MCQAHATFSKMLLDNLYAVFRRKIHDEYNDEEVELTKEETRLIGRLLKGKAPHADFDPYAVRTILISLSFLGGLLFLDYRISLLYAMHILPSSYDICLHCSLMLIGLIGMVLSIQSLMHLNQRDVSFLQSQRVKRYKASNLLSFALCGMPFHILSIIACPFPVLRENYRSYETSYSSYMITS